MSKSSEHNNCPQFEHNCSACVFLGCGSIPPILARMISSKKLLDFYICESSKQRSFIARYGDKPEEYMSGSLFVCAELTPLDKVALYNGLNLRTEENERLLRVFANMWRGKLGVNDYRSFSVGDSCVFGSGNVVFEDP